MKGSCRYGVIEEYVSVVDEEECGRDMWIKYVFE